MNIYDTKVVRCAVCDKCIGEVDYDAEVIFPKCGRCANPLPATHDEHFENLEKKPVVLLH